MKKSNVTKIFFVGVLLVSITIYWVQARIESSSDLPFYGKQEIAVNVTERNKKRINPLRSFHFKNQNNDEVNERFIKGKVWVANFFFTSCPEICPKMSTHLEEVQKEFYNQNDVKILSFTCDPERDNTTQLMTYARLYNANMQQWQFLTGDKVKLYRFARNNLQIVATEGDGGPDDFIHSSNLVLIDRDGYVRGYYDGTNENEVKKMIFDIKKLL